jgi:hypothetical protein
MGLVINSKGAPMIRLSAAALTAVVLGATVLSANPTLVPGYLTSVPVGGSSGTPQGIAVARSNPSTIFWCRNGIWKSTDAGATWGQCGTLSSCVHVRVDPANAGHVYVICGVASSTGGFWRSSDGGTTWEQPQGFIAATSDPTVNTRDGYEVMPDPADFNHVLVSFHSAWAASPNYTNACGVLESTDGGTSWRIAYPVNGMGGPGFGVQFLYDPALGLGDRNTWMLGCQGAGYWRTSDAGATWTKVLSANMVHGGDQIYYSNNGALYTGADASGPWRSIDNGITWQPVELIPTSAYYLSVTCDGYSLYTAAFNTQGPLYVSPESDGFDWKTYLQPDGTTPTLPMGTFEMALDSTNRIMYFSSPQSAAAGIWAMKLITPAIGFSHQSITPASILSDVDRPVTIAVDIAGPVAAAWVDLSQCGGTGHDTLQHTTGTTWTITRPVPAHVAGGTRNIVLTATSAAADTATISFTLQITDNLTPILVSQGKTATASSTQSGNVAANAVDGDAATRWESAASDPQWLEVDLGAPTLVNRVEIAWETAFASVYSIQISNDGASWTTVFSTTVGNGGTDEIYLTPVTTRYVRLYGAQRGTQFAYSIYEMKVYSFTVGATSAVGSARSYASAGPRLAISRNGMDVRAPQGEAWHIDLFKLSGTKMAEIDGVGTAHIDQQTIARGFTVARITGPAGATIEKAAR